MPVSPPTHPVTANIVETGAFEALAVAPDGESKLSDYGPFFHGSDMYVVSMRENNSDFTNSIAIYKSAISDGVNWTRLDTANQPGTNVKILPAVSYPGSGTVIYLAFKETVSGSTSELRLSSFDMATDTYGSLITGGPQVFGSLSELGLNRLSDASFVISFTSQVTNVNPISRAYYATYNGSWSVRTEISDNLDGINPSLRARLDGAVVDTSDTVTFAFHNIQLASSIARSFYTRQLVGGVLGAVSSALYTAPLNGADNYFGPGIYRSASDEIIWPFFKTNPSAPSNSQRRITSLLVGTPSASPSWSTTDVFTPDGVTQFSAGLTAATLLLDEPDLYLFQCLVSAGDPDIPVTVNYFINSGSGWTGPFPYWQAPPDPLPPEDTSDPDLMVQGQNFHINDGSLFGFVEGADEITEQFCHVLFFLLPTTATIAATLEFGIGLSDAYTPPIPATLELGLGLTTGLGFPTLQLVKVVSNTHGGTAVPSNWTLNAAGPTPLSGAGGVPATSVSPGTYVLSETAGPAGYTASSWMCTGGTQVGNQVTIAAGDTVVCTITNSDSGGVTPTPTPPTPNPPPCPDDPIAPPTYHASPEGVVGTAQVQPTVRIYVSQEPQEPVGP